MSTRRIAGAPITWGVCEVPGWGYQMQPDRVLSEMAQLGMTATEMGPEGFLPDNPEELRSLLQRHGLELVGGFVPVVLHDPDRWEMELRRASRHIATLAAGGASMAVLAASTGEEGYETSAALSEDSWAHLVKAIEEVEEAARGQGMSVSLHPHYGTVIETPNQIERFLETCRIGLCLDAGHIMVGGGDAVEIVQSAADRVSHVHLKDVDAALAAKVRDGELGYQEAVGAGLYRVLGAGDVDIGAIVTAVERSGYEGWYVLEQDTVLAGEPAEGHGPIDSARASYRYLIEEVPAASADREQVAPPGTP